MRIATWNINSVRLRLHHVLRYIKGHDIKILWMQEAQNRKL